MEERKAKALDRFVAQLQERLEDKVWAIYHFGSTAKGMGGPESDIDVLVVFSNAQEREVMEVVGEISFDIACEMGEGIEGVVISEEEYRKEIGWSPFLWEAVEHGRTLFARSSSTEWDLKFQPYVELSKDYLGYARDALQEKKLRLAIDTAYHAAELLVKDLIMSTNTTLASSHGGIIGQFGNLLILPGQIEKELGKNLHISLELRAKARYKPESQVSEEDARFVLSVVERLHEIANERLP